MATPRKRPEDKLKAGRKAVPITRNLDQIEILAGFGLTDDEIAAVLGISRWTLMKWRKQDGLVEEAIRKGKAKADLNVVKSLYNRATVEHDTTAMIFWLKNRQPERFRDRHEQALSTESPVRIMIVPAKMEETKAEENKIVSKDPAKPEGKPN